MPAALCWWAKKNNSIV